MPSKKRSRSTSVATPRKRKYQPDTGHLPGYKFEEDQELYIIELKESQALDWGMLTTKFNSRYPGVPRSKGALQVHYSRSLKPGEARRPSQAPAYVPPEENNSHDHIIPDRVNELHGDSDSKAVENTPIDGHAEYNSDETEDANSGSRFTVSKQASKTIISLGRKANLPEPTRLTQEFPTAKKGGLDSLFMKEVEEIVGRGRKRTRNATYENLLTSDDTEEEEEPKNKKSRRSIDIRSNDKDTRKANTEHKPVAKEIMAANGSQHSRKTIDVTKPDSASLLNENKKRDEPEAVEDHSAAYTKRPELPTQPSQKVDAPQPSSSNTLQIPMEQPQMDPGKQRMTYVQEPTQSNPHDWEMCIPGHKEWELQRLNNPRMPDSVRNPRNRIVEYNVRNGSFRLRKRKSADPPADMMEPIYISTPPRVPEPRSTNLPADFPYGSYPKRMNN